MLIKRLKVKGKRGREGGREVGREGRGLNQPCCSYKGPKFDSQYPHQADRDCLYLLLQGIQTLFQPLQTHMRTCTHTLKTVLKLGMELPVVLLSLNKSNSIQQLQSTEGSRRDLEKENIFPYWVAIIMLPSNSHSLGLNIEQERTFDNSSDFEMWYFDRNFSSRTSRSL